ncbi:MAG: hypothetical protein OJF47_000470 [Nitrospira sp.]|nr:MAG: hypothetical protein OJF47_000470 [Nitrospira sp.]
MSESSLGVLPTEMKGEGSRQRMNSPRQLVMSRRAMVASRTFEDQ